MHPTESLGLRQPVNLVSRRAISYWASRAALGWAVIIGAQLVVVWRTGSGHRVNLLVLAVSAVLALAHTVVMPQWRYRVHRWECTELAVYTQSGWLNQQRRIAPVSRIQTVDTERGPLEQLFGLTNVTVTTASAAGPLKINGLTRRTAEQLVEELTTTSAVALGDAT